MSLPWCLMTAFEGLSGWWTLTGVSESMLLANASLLSLLRSVPAGSSCLLLSRTSFFDDDEEPRAIPHEPAGFLALHSQ
ncbi:hypothetical protein CIPAW_16G073300 [Carya illinoinensis]|uniref:Secreted protein n=1 Tax=Carya illinoinensis TaxID=32201 RepID=A0A8T1N6M3_CARIL|nr:hypothetical protein CIPAW_16G073300 [Carya illinoinensis]